MFTRTKIVCTIGPAVASYEKMLELIDAGMNVARLNFSHGTHEEHLKSIKNLKKARKERGVPLALMLDTHGPKIRVGKLPGDAIDLKPGQRLKLVGAEKARSGEIPVHPPEVIDALSVGTKVLFDDGYIISTVVAKGEKDATVEIQNPGVLKSGKGVNLPGGHVKAERKKPTLTPKERKAKKAEKKLLKQSKP